MQWSNARLLRKQPTKKSKMLINYAVAPRCSTESHTYSPSIESNIVSNNFISVRYCPIGTVERSSERTCLLHCTRHRCCFSLITDHDALRIDQMLHNRNNANYNLLFARHSKWQSHMWKRKFFGDWMKLMLFVCHHFSLFPSCTKSTVFSLIRNDNRHTPCQCHHHYQCTHSIVMMIE